MKPKTQDQVTITNMDYCLAFLKNGGERVRAIRLYMDFAGCTDKQAIKHVDSLDTKVPLSQ